MYFVILLSCSTFVAGPMRIYEHPRVNWMRHLGEDSSQSSSTDEAAKVYTAPWLCRKGLGDGCSMMMHDATMWNDRFGWLGLVWFVMFGWVCLVRSFCLYCFALFTSLPTKLSKAQRHGDANDAKGWAALGSKCELHSILVSISIHF